MAHSKIFLSTCFDFIFIINTFRFGFSIVEYKIDNIDFHEMNIITILRDLFMFKISFWSDYFERTLV